MPLSSAINHILIDGAGGTGTVATLTDLQLLFNSIEDATETVQVGDRTDHRVGARQNMSFISYVNGTTFGKIGTQDLYAAMLASTDKRLRFVFDGSSNNTYTYDPVKVTVTPRVGPLDQNKSKIYINDAGTAGVPPSGWDDLGEIAGGSSPSFEVISENNGLGQPIFSRLSMSWEIDLFTEGSTAIDAYTGKIKVALAHGTTPETYTMFDDVKHYNIPNSGDNFVYTRLFLTAAWADPRGDSKLVFPTMADHLGGFEVSAVASATDKSDFFTIS